ncbi:general secretion pathway protein GspB [Lysobacter sp. 1R34A]|uniref:general secretion pathway protein GspB n=1 Tax=Lysobacter sp. 1R34A TaxID=3445786 RepID=UPI003EEEECF5
MSLILEALRKSEAERRRGESPDLYAELPPLARAPHRATPTGGWLALAAVAVAAGLVWWLSRPPAAEPVANTADEVAGRERPVAAATPRIEPPAAIESPAVAAAPIGNPLPANRPANRPAPMAQATAAAAPPRAPAGRRGGDEEQAEESETEPPAVATDPPPTPALVPPPPPLPAPPPVVVPEPAPPVAIANNDGLLLLADLPVAERKQLPPLKLSMHMWNDAPAQRFVIIDGQRLSEGSRIGDAVLVAIRTDGVVLDWNGRRLKLPIR